MKKFLSVLTVALAVAVFIPAMTCEAVDYYVGTYDDGSEAYLMTETIEDRSGYDYSEDMIIVNTLCK